MKNKETEKKKRIISKQIYFKGYFTQVLEFMINRSQPYGSSKYLSLNTYTDQYATCIRLYKIYLVMNQPT